MEAYKKEFIEFMVDCDVLKFGDFTLEKRKKIPIFHECRSICNRIPVKETWRVLRKSNSRDIWR